MSSDFIKKLQTNKSPKTILFPEYTDQRIKAALKVLQDQGICRPAIIASKNHSQFLTFTRNPQTDLHMQAALLLKAGKVDAVISGSCSKTADTLRPALQLIGTKKPKQRASGCMIMTFQKKTLFFADCVLNIQPTPSELANIAADTADTAKKLNIKPVIAMLSFSTHQSAKHPEVEKIRKATKILQKKRPDLIVDGEIQVDAALDPIVAKKKASRLKGNANVLIFPDLNSANIGYKLVERLGAYTAIGSITQGLKKPYHDLSRGCSINDIINLSIITCQL